MKEEKGYRGQSRYLPKQNSQETTRVKKKNMKSKGSTFYSKHSPTGTQNFWEYEVLKYVITSWYYLRVCLDGVMFWGNVIF